MRELLEDLRVGVQGLVHVGLVGVGVQLVEVGDALDRGLDEGVGRELVGRQFDEPCVGGELGGSHVVHAQHRHRRVLDLGVLDHLLALLVRGADGRTGGRR